MVCSEKELGLSDDHTGVIILDPDLPVGQPLRDALGDTVLEVELTPNVARANCIVGLAREIAALTGQPWRAPGAAAAAPLAAATAYGSVASSDPDLCARYSASLIENVIIQPSPPWMQRRLQYAGQRPINNIVDVTNYVMLETGQPLHAFDYETLQGGIVVRRARPGETMQTLDGVERQLTPDMLLITDDSGPIALAGVMGGAATEVTEGTRHIFLESANFNFVNIRRTSQQLRLHSEAAQRFGRGGGPRPDDRRPAARLPAHGSRRRRHPAPRDRRYLPGAAEPQDHYAAGRGGHAHPGHGVQPRRHDAHPDVSGIRLYDAPRGRRYLP